MSSNKFLVCTRGSELALTQTRMAISSLKTHNIEAEELIIKTRGDKDYRPFTQIAGDGFFTKELERALLSGDAQMAIHSSKDLPSMTHESLPWKAYSHREDTADLLVVNPNVAEVLADGSLKIKSGAKIGTSSPRRVHQLRHRFSELEISELRGNVPTRLNKVVEGVLDGVVLAKAGVVRLGLLDYAKQKGLLVYELDFVTAPCQGIIAAQATQSNVKALDKITNHELEEIAKAEKSVLAILGGGCHLPLGTQITKTATGYILRFFLGTEGEPLHFECEGSSLNSVLQSLFTRLTHAPQKATKRVWVTAPIQHILKPALLCAKKTLQPVAFPLLEIVPCWKISALEDLANNKSDYGAVVFASQFAVQIFMTEADAFLDVRAWLKKVKIFSVGPSTTQKLKEYGIENIITADESHADALCNLIDRHRVQKRILVPGQINSTSLKKLNRFGNRAKGLILYKIRASQSALSVEVPQIATKDHLVLTSPSAAREFVLRCAKTPALKSLTVWAFGPSTSRELKFLGVNHLVNPTSGSWESVLDAIAKK